MRRTDLAAVLGLVALVALAHRQVLLGDAVWCYEDMVFWYAPARGLVEQALRQGAIAGWDPWVGLGQPLVTNPAASPLHPLNFVALLGGLHALTVLHLALGGAFTYALARDRGARPAAAWIGGVSFAFAGPLLAYAQENPYHVLGLAWLPLALLLFLRALERDAWRSAVAAGVPVALMLYGGEPQGWYFAAATLAASVIAHGRFARGFAYLCIVFAVAALLSAAQIAATLASLSGSARGIGEALEARLQFSMHPLRLVTLALPFATGVPFPENSLWGNGLAGSYRFWVHTPYVGLLALALAPLALRTRLAWAMLGVAALAAWMALGRYGGLYALADAAVPGMGLFRYPEKWVGALILPLCLLGALGAEAALRGEGRRKLAISLGICATLGAVAALGAGALRGVIGGVALFPAPALIEAAVDRLRHDGLWALGVCAVSALALARGWALAAVATIDAVVVGLTPVVLAPPALLNEAGPLVAAMRPHERFRRLPHPPRPRVPVDADGYVANQAAARATGALHSLGGVARTVQVHGPHWDAREGAALHEALWGDDPLAGGALYGARYYILADGEPPPAWLRQSRLRPILRAEALGAVLLEDPDALPRLYRAASVGDAARVHADSSAESAFLRDEADLVEVETSGGAAALLVLSDSYHRGWAATLDGAPVPIHRVNDIARGVDVPAGRSVVRFSYTHPHLRAGIITSAVAALAVAALVWAPRLTRRRRLEEKDGDTVERAGGES